MILCVLCAALLVLSIAGCKDRNNTQVPDPVPSETVTQPVQIPDPVPDETDPPEIAEPTENTEPQMPVIPDHIVVSTPYGYMQYRDQWAEFMRTEQQVEGDAVSVFFTAIINDVEYALFTVTIGGDGEQPICEMTDTAGVKRDVFVHVEELVMNPALTEGEQNRLYAMQEEINYIIENIK